MAGSRTGILSKVAIMNRLPRVTIAALALLSLGCRPDTLDAPNTATANNLRYSARLDTASVIYDTGDARVGKSLVLSVNATLSIKNLSSVSRLITGGGSCPKVGPFTLRLYTIGDNRLVWNSRKAYPGEICVLSLVVDKELAPGDSFDITTQFLTIDIISDSVPRASYRFTVTPDGINPSLDTQVPAGVLDLSQGRSSQGVVAIRSK
jgi:hypothetical protein